MTAKRSVDDLLPQLYTELRKLAERALASERGGHTLQPTALVHEAYLRLVGQNRGAMDDPAYLFAAASGVIRRVLIDHARRHRAAKREGSQVRVALTAQLVLTHESDLDVLALHEALERLATHDARQAQLVELRFFGGLTVAEAADVLRVSLRTAEADWTMARAWLRRELTRGAG